MLRSLKDLESYKVSATDGEVGKTVDFLFDDQHFTTRYLIVDTSGFWEGEHKVLVSPISFRNVDWSTRLFHLNLSQAKLKDCPSVDLDKPISRQYERQYSQYYGWPYYWGAGDTWAWGTGAYPYQLAANQMKAEPAPIDHLKDDPHLRSAKEVIGYHIQGSDGNIGHVEDFIIDDETWTIRYLVIDTSNWWFGKKVLVSPYWTKNISWKDNLVYLDLTMDAIRNSPSWNPESLVNREYEQRLYDYYGRPAYWLRGPALEANKAKPLAQPRL